MVMPDTTPMPKETAKIRVQKFDSRKYRSRRVKRYKPSSTAMKEARPTVNAGNRMCQAITHTNCKRERNRAPAVTSTLLRSGANRPPDRAATTEGGLIAHRTCGVFHSQSAQCAAGPGSVLLYRSTRR